ncbi:MULTISPECIES: BadF/BadG/BcrA/BcrD ATPase family protein [Rhodomicrobium]|uniref:BadF/BadG/BcrA/BcrD ATPase family protein n=1 Tax=Rhodomicrobium TaxID=1068 RepID=UPI000B4A8295|nr:MULTISPECIES: BadF/BadG/BcrA/BcrD ATPase family protein [Rhodomicrobium]
MTLLIAVDGGGTSCRAVVADGAGRRLGEGLAGSANIASDMLIARDNIAEAARLALQQARLPEARIADCAAVLGLAGANIGDKPGRIAALLPFRVSHVETDARIALQGALGTQDGAVAVLGTGSVFIARDGGRIRSIGGWGPVIGDLCSGGRLGRALLEEVLRAYDRLRPGTELSEAILARYGNDPDALVDYAKSAKPADFASFAPLIFDHADRGDAIASDILKHAIAELELTLRTLLASDEAPFCLLGGLASSYSRHLSDAFRQRERRPEGNAISGALAMAVAMFGQPQGAKRDHG